MRQLFLVLSRASLSVTSSVSIPAVVAFTAIASSLLCTNTLSLPRNICRSQIRRPVFRFARSRTGLVGSYSRTCWELSGSKPSAPEKSFTPRTVTPLERKM